MPRHARLDSPGTLHHVIIRGIEKRDIVKDDIDRSCFVSRLGEVARTSTPQPATATACHSCNPQGETGARVGFFNRKNLLWPRFYYKPRISSLMKNL